MQTLEELLEIKKATLDKMAVLGDDGKYGIRVVVGLATCGVAAGAKPVYDAILDELNKRNVKNVSVKQTGCIGMCQFEPIVEVFEEGKEKVTYVQMTPEKARKVVVDHLINNQPVAEYTVGSVTK